MATAAIPRPFLEDLRALGKPLEAMLEWAGDLGCFTGRVAKATPGAPAPIALQTPPGK